jgi:hypothetical protein
MPKYAENTRVDAAASREEIERALRRWGATEFLFGWRDEAAVVGFKLRDRSIRFLLPLPRSDNAEFRRDSLGRDTPHRAKPAYEQAYRQRWRALLLCIKAKLESVEAGIESVEEAFCAQLVAPGQRDRTVGEMVLPSVVRAYEEGSALPELLPMLALPSGRDA